jgi:serine/threonine-protein kinase
MIGEKIHSYEITEHLGKGGMGNVYKATDTMLGRDVALKMLHPQLTMEAQFLERFKKEARVLAQLLHPNIAVIYNFIEQGGNHFMVMEYVEGTNLDDLLKKYKALSPEFLIPVFIQVLEGLQHAHRKNVFHRDIKPANLMLTPDGTVKLMDFGIAKVAGEQKMTQVNKIVGTVEFMAPELIQGKDASAASDIYAAGVTFYELLSGKLPFESDTDFNLMQAILKKKINPPEKLNASVPKALSDIVMKALDKKPENRFADARAFQQALIAAFPQYREINLARLQFASSTSAQPSGAITQPNKSLMAAAAMETRLETSQQPITSLTSFKDNVVKNKKLWLIAAALLLVLITTGILVSKNNNGDKIKIAEANGDTVKVPEPDNSSGTGITEIVKPQETVIVTPPENKQPENTATPVKTDKTKDKPAEKKTELNEKPKETETKKPVPPPVEPRVEHRDIFIKSKVEVNLYLRDNLDNAPERKDITVSFTVSSPVIYEGVTVIKQGAIASGVIKLGKIQTDIDINSVMGANGQEISLKALRGHGRRNEISTSRSYTAIIRVGTRMKF